MANLRDLAGDAEEEGEEEEGGGGEEEEVLGLPLSRYCLVGLVVKASSSREEEPGFESRLRRDFSGVESYQ